MLSMIDTRGVSNKRKTGPFHNIPRPSKYPSEAYHLPFFAKTSSASRCPAVGSLLSTRLKYRSMSRTTSSFCPLGHKLEDVDEDIVEEF